MAKYSVTKVKVFEGMEGHGFNATLMRDGKAVATVIDDASGGPTMFNWLDERAKPVEFVALNYKDKPFERKGTPEEAAFWEHGKSLGKYVYHGQEFHHSPEYVAETLMVEATLRKNVTARLKRGMKTKVLFVRDGAEYSVKPKVPGVDPLLVVGAVAEKYPGATILNTMPFDDAVYLCVKLEAAR
ncbi:TPA: hypothetical protein ACUNF5_006671 [Burkholderia orbicola]